MSGFHKQKAIAILLLSFTLLACKSNKKVDLIIKNATIYSVNEEFTIYESMAIAKGKIVGLGSNAEIENKFTSKQAIDMHGKPVYPGFIDAHAHFLGYGLGLSNAWLAGTKSWEHTVQILKEHQEEYPTQWVQGRGWNQNEWDVKEFPTKELLDKAFPEKPVLLIRIDGHAAIANSKAMEMANFNSDTTVSGGEIVKSNGVPTGVLIDKAINLVRNAIPASSTTEKEEALYKAQANCFAVGLTSIGDAGTAKDDALLMDSLQQAGKLKMKINAMLSPTQENFEHFVAHGIYTTPHLTIRTIKLFADGALGSRGAWMLEPYSDALHTSGLQLDSKENLSAYCKKAFDGGYQVATHAIGDAAVRLMLEIYEQFLPIGNDLRWRIEHSQIIHPDDFNRYGTLGIVPSIQTTHATSDMLWAVDRIGHRIKTAYAYQDLLAQNGWLPNGSDFPIEHINPLYGFYAGVARKNLDGIPTEGFQMENALTREQALRSMTIWAAKSAFEENVKGSLEVGKDADFVVLEKDIMTIAEAELPHVKVLKTYSNGELVFGK